MAEINFDATKVNPNDETISVNDSPPNIGSVVGDSNSVQNDGTNTRKRRRSKREGEVEAPTNPQYKVEYAAYLEACRKRKADIAAAAGAVKVAQGEKKQALAAWDVHINELKLAKSRLEAEPVPVAPKKHL